MAAVLTLLSGCDNYPKDIRNTLDNIRANDTLRVGVIENPPWVIRGDSGPDGVEPEIVRALADRLDARVSWHWGSTAVLVEALEQHQLDLVIGGLTTGPHLPGRVAATNPYYTTRYTIGYRPSLDPGPEDINGQTVAVPMISPMHKVLEDKNAETRPMENPEASDLPLAGPDWKLRPHGYIPRRWPLMTRDQVMVVAKGENAWIGVLQRHLDGLDGLNERLEHYGARP